MQDAKAIARSLREIAHFLNVRGESPFRVRAYDQAARTIEARAGELADRIANGTLKELDGIGPKIERVVTELWFTDRANYLDTLQHELPASVVELAAIRGVGPRRAMTLYRVLGITNPEELLDACEQHRVSNLRGFGAATEQRLLAAVREWQRSRSPPTAGRPDPQLPLPLNGGPEAP